MWSKKQRGSIPIETGQSRKPVLGLSSIILNLSAQDNILAIEFIQTLKSKKTHQFSCSGLPPSSTCIPYRRHACIGHESTINTYKKYNLKASFSFSRQSCVNILDLSGNLIELGTPLFLAVLPRIKCQIS